MKRIMLFCIFVIIFTSCTSRDTLIDNQDSALLLNSEIEDIFRLITSDSFSEVSLYVEELNQARSFELQAISIDDQHYLVLDEFAKLANKINSGYGIIKRMSVDNFNKETGILDITYNKGINYSEDAMKSVLNSAAVKVESVTIEGEDLAIPINVSSHGVIDENGIVYLPVYLFNYYIFSNSSVLYRYEQNEYKIIANSWYEAEEFMISNRTYFPETSYHTTHAITEDYLRSAFGYSGTYTSSENLTEIEIVYDELGKFISLQDSHYYVYSMDEKFYDMPDEFMEKMTKEHLDYLQTVVWKMGVQREEKPEWLSENYFYFPVASFVDNDNIEARDIYFSNTWNMFVNKNEGDKKTVIFDIRDNPGGSLAYVYILAEMMIQGDFNIFQENSINGEFLSSIRYEFSNNPRTANYDMIILINEGARSASIGLAGILKDNTNTVVYGTEPLFKDANHLAWNILPIGTILSRSAGNYLMVNREGIAFNEDIIVDVIMTDKEIDDWLDSLND